jgi:hypothetical protein
MPLSIYTAMQGNIESVIYIAVVLVLISFAIMVDIDASVGGPQVLVPRRKKVVFASASAEND